MNKLFLLLKNYFKMFINAFTNKKNRNANISGGTLVLVFSIVFICIFTFSSFGQVQEAINIGEPEVAMLAFVLMGILFTALSIVLKSTNSKKNVDSDMLLSLPISKTTIVLAKVLRDYLFDIITIGAIFLPGPICYFILVEGASFSIVIMAIIIVLLGGLFSNSIAIILKTIIFKLTSRLKNAEVFQTLINVIITILVMGVYLFINSSIVNIDTGYAEKLFSFYPLQMMVEIILENNILNLLIYASICVFPFIISIYLLVRSLTHTKKVEVKIKKELVYTKRKPRFTLLKREINKYFRSTVYVINTIMGPLISLIFATLILIAGPTYLLPLFEQLKENEFISLVANNFEIICVLILALLASSVVTTHSTISLEGKELWILKANPISFKQIVEAKLGLNFLLGLITILSSFILCFSIGFKYLPFSILLNCLAVIFSAILGFIINLRYPKLDWQSEEEVVKRGMSTLVSLLTCIIPILIAIILYLSIFIKIINPFLYLAIVIVVMIILDILLYKTLLNKGKQKFKEIN